MKLSVYGIAVIAMSLLAACGSKSSYKAQNNSESQDITLSNEKPEEQGIAANTSDSSAVASLGEDTSTGISLQSGSPAFTDWDKKIIKTANITLEVKSFATFTSDIHNRLKSFGAYTAGEQQSQSDTRLENNLTVKVPVDQFDNLVNSIGGDDIKVLSKNITTDDVSGEVIDTKARIEAKKQLRDKYSELLKEAKNMKDILQVQGEINNIQEELEAASGRVSYLTHSAAYSTVTLHYYQYLEGKTSDSEQPSFFTNIREAFATGGSIILNVLLFVVSIWPLLLAGVGLYVYMKRGKMKKASV